MGAAAGPGLRAQGLRAQGSGWDPKPSAGGPESPHPEGAGACTVCTGLGRRRAAAECSSTAQRLNPAACLRLNPAAGDMARRDEPDDYVVIDPLLEKAKGKFSRAAQKAKKEGLAWAGRPKT
jgi:hypothetical protein